ncbi:MAG TPA: hypothetical protein VJQ53_04780 [Candidatus Eisenbacteria bacterium]|nr:hypothetical protein [Candidatus Eisenbacteria bacterium]
MTDPLWLLALIVLVGIVCFYAGRLATRREAQAYLEAAKSISEITNAVATQSNSYTAALDKAVAESASLRQEISSLREAGNHNAGVVAERLGAVDSALITLFQGFERAGLARAPGSRPGKQVGEKET